MTFTVMDTDGITVSPVTAPDSEAAATLVEAQGYKVLDVMDDVVVIAPGA